jgi:hypothetical protein
MKVITDGSGDGIALPFPAPLARNAPLIERPCDSCRRHPIVFNLPGHVTSLISTAHEEVLVSFEMRTRFWFPIQRVLIPP